VPRLAASIYRVEGFAYGLNYGVNKVRFPAPLPVGGRVRRRSTLADVTDVDRAGIQVTLAHTFERDDDAQKPVCVAEAVIRYYQPLSREEAKGTGSTAPPRSQPIQTDY
jgi:acyl dehydratase